MTILVLCIHKNTLLDCFPDFLEGASLVLAAVPSLPGLALSVLSGWGLSSSLRDTRHVTRRHDTRHVTRHHDTCRDTHLTPPLCFWMVGPLGAGLRGVEALAAPFPCSPAFSSLAASSTASSLRSTLDIKIFWHIQ